MTLQVLNIWAAPSSKGHLQEDPKYAYRKWWWVKKGQRSAQACEMDPWLIIGLPEAFVLEASCKNRQLMFFNILFVAP